MKSAKRFGPDSISSRILKVIPDAAAIYLTHVINCNIKKGMFTDILKVSRILPILKKNKNTHNLDSYRLVKTCIAWVTHENPSTMTA